MSLILNVETSTKNCSVSLSKDGVSLFLKEEIFSKYSHAEKIHIFIRDVLKKSCFNLSDLSAICISKGPGSYTGLRIGVSTVKGLCFGLNIPLLSIDTLSVMVQGFNLNYNILIPMIDACRNEVYTAVFDKKKNKISPIKAIILNKNSFKEYHQDKVCIFGNGAYKAKKLLKFSASYFPEIYPSAYYMSYISNKIFKKEKKFENINNFEPFYLKDFIVI